MTPRSENPAWKRVLLIAAVAAAIAVFATEPAEADETRHCDAWLAVSAAGHPNTNVGGSYTWTVKKTVSGYHPNAAREEARRAAITCMRSHWEARDADAVPLACQSQGDLEFHNYPFVNLAGRLRQDVCAARSALMQPRQSVDLVLFIRGDRGCVEHHGSSGYLDPVERVEIASGYWIDCPTPQEIVQPETGQIGIAPPQQLTCVGESCAPPLPNTRLPGHDISDSAIPGRTWRTCQHSCQDNAACRAWTFRRAGTSGAGSPEHCLLKSEAGTQTPDACCDSGIKD